MSNEKHTKGEMAVHPVSDNIYGAYVVPVEHVHRLVGGSSDPAFDRDNYAQKIASLGADRHGRGLPLANARRIVQCWNAHDSLARSLADMIDWLDDGNRVLSDACRADVERARAALSKSREAGE